MSVECGCDCGGEIVVSSIKCVGGEVIPWHIMEVVEDVREVSFVNYSNERAPGRPGALFGVGEKLVLSQ